MFKLSTRLSLVALLLFCGLNVAIAQTYEFINKISLPSGDGKWDYLKMDGERERLYVSHADRVHVIDLKSEKQIAEFMTLLAI